MRLWHQFLLPYLPRQQLLGQHRECCALRGQGWGRNHSVVNYVFQHEPDKLVLYHYLVMREMKRRGYNPDPIWLEPNWRGKVLEWSDWIEATAEDFDNAVGALDGCVYAEHDDAYLQECIENLRSKDIIINFNEAI